MSSINRSFYTITGWSIKILEQYRNYFKIIRITHNWGAFVYNSREMCKTSRFSTLPVTNICMYNVYTVQDSTLIWKKFSTWVIDPAKAHREKMYSRHCLQIVSFLLFTRFLFPLFVMIIIDVSEVRTAHTYTSVIMCLYSSRFQRREYLYSVSHCALGW